MGDPAGNGSEISVKALSRSEIYEQCRPVIIGEAYACEWKETADRLWKEHPHQQKGYTNYKKRTEN